MSLYGNFRSLEILIKRVYGLMQGLDYGHDCLDDLQVSSKGDHVHVLLNLRQILQHLQNKGHRVKIQ